MMRETDKSVQEINVKQALEELIEVTKQKTLRQIGLINLDDFSYLEQVGLIDVSLPKHNLSAAYRSFADALEELKRYVEAASEEELKRQIYDGYDVERIIDKMLDEAAVWFMYFADDVDIRLSKKRGTFPSNFLSRVYSMVNEISIAIRTMDRRQYQPLLEQHIKTYWLATVTVNDELEMQEFHEIGYVIDKALETLADTVINKYWDEDDIKSIIADSALEEGIYDEALTEECEKFLYEVFRGIWDHLDGYDIASEVLSALED